MLEARREMLPLWADLMPALPTEVAEEAEQKIAAALHAGDPQQ
jgi:hypothetical protein